MSATIQYKIVKASFPVRVTITDVDVEPNYVWPYVDQAVPGTYEYTGLSYNTTYVIQFVDNRECSKTYNNLKMLSP